MTMKRIAKRFVVAAIVAGCLSLQLASCAGKLGQTAVNVTASDALQQTAGVLTAIGNLPPAPTDPETQKQLAGWQAWARYLAPLVGSVALSVGKAALTGGL